MLLTGLTITFLKEFCLGLWVCLPLLLSLGGNCRPAGTPRWKNRRVVTVRQHLLVIYHSNYRGLR